jgi:hypothetical protein
VTAVRVALLENLGKYSHHLPEKMVDEQVYAHMATGFTAGAHTPPLSSST